jgi:2-phosphoglycerate kinase
MANPRDWKVLLLGGGTGTGKTQLSLALGRRFDVAVLEGDLLRGVIESAVAQGSDPDLHPFRDATIWDQPIEEILDRSLRLSQRVCRICEWVLVRQHYVERPLILEAFWILPEFAAQTTFGDLNLTGEVRSLFLFEPDLDALQERLHGRDGEVGLPQEQPSRLAMFHEHGVLIKQRAEALGLAVLESRPFETLEARALAALGLDG